MPAAYSIKPINLVLSAALQALHEHVVRTSPVGNTIERPVALDARLVRA